MKLDDGHILSSNLQMSFIGRSDFAQLYSQNSIQMGQIVEVIPVDDDRNISKRYVEYDILVFDGQVTMSRYHNCKALDSIGSENNFSETTYQPITDGKRGKKDDSEDLQYKNGAMVLIVCVGGNKEGAAIISAIQHPNMNNDGFVNKVSRFVSVGSSTSRDERLEELPTLNPGARKEDGQRILGEFNGLRWNVNKHGELSVVYQGLKDDRGFLSAFDTQPTILKFNKDGEFFVIDNLDQEIKLSRKDQNIKISSGNNPPDFIEINRESQSIFVEMSKDEVHTIGQDRIVSIKRDEVEEIKGRSETTIGKTRTNTIKKDHIEQVTGTWRAKTGGEIVFDYPKFKLGSDGSSEPIVLGNIWNTYHTTVIVATLNALIAAVGAIKGALDSHEHNVTWTGDPGSGSTTGGPNSGAPGIPPSPAPAAPAAAFSKKSFSE